MRGAIARLHFLIVPMVSLVAILFISGAYLLYIQSPTNKPRFPLEILKTPDELHTGKTSVEIQIAFGPAVFARLRS